MKYPDFIKKGEELAFVAPSFGCVIEPYHTAFKYALKRFEEMGYKIKLGPNCFEDKGIGISNKPEACASELMDIYLDKSVTALISCGGGELMCEILDFLDFDKLSLAKPKWFMGYSDNTNFTFTLNTLADTAAIYGPCAPTFGQAKWEENVKDAWEVFAGEKKSVSGYSKWEKDSIKDANNPLLGYNLTEEKALTLKNCSSDGSIEMQGRLLGGCLDTLLTLIGTKYDKVANFNKKYEEDGIIWFLEACDLSVLQIRRGLWQMKHAGWFDNAKGFIFGRPYHFDEPDYGVDRIGAVTSVLEEMGLPIILDADLGHLPPAMPIVSGAIAKVKARENIIIDYIFA